MMPDNRDANSAPTPFISSLAADAWHGVSDRYSFERWHFDALSDDGREALVISFYDNYPFSPRYLDRRTFTGDMRSDRHPAVTFLYAVDGKTVMEAVNEWDGDRFSASSGEVNCSIGDSTFRLEKSNYGSGYLVHIDVITARRRHIEADLEWVSIESDLFDLPQAAEKTDVAWNLVAPRSDVSGRIVRTGSRGKTKTVVHFRGTGYHDHFQSWRPFQSAIGSRCWGRAHFPDTTAVFQHIEYSDEPAEASCIALIKKGKIAVSPSSFIRLGNGADGKLPSADFIGQDGLSISVRSKTSLQRGFFEQRMIADIEISTSDGTQQTTEGLVEFCRPGGLTNPLYRWMSDLKIGRNGGSPYF